MLEYLKTQFLHNQFFSAAIVASLVGTLVIYFKTAPRQFFHYIKSRFIYTVTIYQNDPLYDDFEFWFYNNHNTKYRDVEGGLKKSKMDYGEVPGGDSKNPVIYYRQKEGRFFIKYKGIILFISKGREKLDHATDVRSVYFDQYYISCFRSIEGIKVLLADCVKLRNATLKANELKVYSHNSYGEWYSQGNITSKSIDNVILEPMFKRKLLSVLDGFVTSKDWYDQSSIFYKLGLGFFGDPGNGKTSLALSIANYLNRDLYTLDLNSINENHYLKTVFSSIGKNAVLLIEDIDGFYNLREPVKKDSKLSFSTFLNCLDGVFFKEGLIVIITTNKIEMVDDALKRKGRLDFINEVKRPTDEMVKEYLRRFFNCDMPDDFYYGEQLSMCDIQALCLEYQDDFEGLINYFLTNLVTI